MHVGLLGDTHANYGWMLYALDKFNREGVTTILQVGDFGFYQPQLDHNFSKKTNLLLKNYGQKMYVVPGNHEDYDQLENLPQTDDGWEVWADNISVAPRGHRWEWDGVSFVALGGAPSVDRSRRKELQALPDSPKLWWEQEFITQEDVDRVTAGGYADVMVAHDAPHGVQEISKRLGGNPGGFAGVDLLYATDGRLMMDKAFKAVAPETFIHGHYHFLVTEKLNVRKPGQDMWHSCHILGLSNDETNFSLGSYNTETRKARAWDIFLDYTKYREAGGPR